MLMQELRGQLEGNTWVRKILSLILIYSQFNTDLVIRFLQEKKGWLISTSQSVDWYEFKCANNYLVYLLAVIIIYMM